MGECKPEPSSEDGMLSSGMVLLWGKGVYRSPSALATMLKNVPEIRAAILLPRDDTQRRRGGISCHDDGPYEPL